MGIVELLIAPLQALLGILGTGATAGAASGTMRADSRALGSIRDESQRALATVGDWTGAGKSAATTAAGADHTATTAVSERGTAIAEIIDRAAARVESGTKDVEGTIDSFARTATAMGPSLLTPAGLFAILPIAAHHLSQGLDAVSKVRVDLDSETAAMRAIGEQQNLAATTSGVSAAQPAAATVDRASNARDTGTGVEIRLPDGSVAIAPNERAAKAVRAALTQLGVPYSWGGTTPGQGLDCSGLTQWAYRQAGVELPRLAQEQDSAGFAVSQADLQPGDLAVWSGHVAMYIGNGQMVEAGDPVSVSPVRTDNIGQAFEGFFRPN